MQINQDVTELCQHGVGTMREIVVMTKAELIAKVEAGHDVFGELLLELADKKEDAKAILDVISAAEARLMVALANVEGEALAEEANV
jgi:hypothetical protein